MQLYFIHQLTEGQLHEISDNFDVVLAITSSRPLTVRPGTFGELRMSYGFTTTITENLPIVGVIEISTSVSDLVWRDMKPSSPVNSCVESVFKSSPNKTIVF